MRDRAGAQTVQAVVDGREISGAQEIRMVAAHSRGGPQSMAAEFKSWPKIN